MAASRRVPDEIAALPLSLLAPALRAAAPRLAREAWRLSRARPRRSLADWKKSGDETALVARLLEQAASLRASALPLFSVDGVPSDEAIEAWAAERGVGDVLGWRGADALELDASLRLFESTAGRHLSVGCLLLGRCKAKAGTDFMAELSARGEVLLRARRLLAAEACARAAWQEPTAAAEPESEALAGYAGRLRAALEAAGPAGACGGDARLDGDTLVWRSGDVEVRVPVAPAGGRALVAACTCGEEPCAHRAEALAAALDLVLFPDDAERQALEGALDRPGWERLLLALDDEPEEAPAATPAATLGWQLTAEGGLALHPVLVDESGRARAAGAPSLAALTSGEAGGSATDLACAFMLSSGQAGAVVSALLALVGHRAVFLEGAPAKVQRAHLELLVEEHDDGSLALGVGIDGERVEAESLGSAGAALVLLQPERGRVVVVERDPALASLVDTVRSLPERLPASARAELLRRLSRLEERMPVRLPPSLMGEEVAAEGRLVLRMTPTQQALLRVEAGTRALSGAPFLPPGEGPACVAGVSGAQRVLARRRLEEEPRVARAVLDALPLPQEAAPWTWLLDEEGQVLDLLGALSARPEVEVVWPEGRSLFRVTRPAAVADLKVRVKRTRDWFAVDGGVSIDEGAVSLQLLLDAARSGQRYVPLREGEWLTLSDELRARLKEASSALYEHGPQLRAGRAAVPVLDDVFGEALEDAEEAQSSFRRLLSGARAASEDTPPVPAGLNATLRPYQRAGFTWMSRLCSWGAGGCLADEMGLGKTLQTLTLLLSRAPMGPALVVAPTSVCSNWRREGGRFAPELKVRLLKGGARDDRLDELGPYDVLVASYGLVMQKAEALSRQRFSTLVLDEAQAVKNPSTQRTRAVRRLSADARIALSGTPVENHLGEIWSLFSVLNPGLLGPWPTFFRRYAAPIERDGDEEARADLLRLISPFLLRRTKGEVAKELPERIEVMVPVELSEDERALYEATRRRAEIDVATAVAADKDRARMTVLSSLTRLRRLACHPRLDDKDSPVPSSKLARCLELVDEIVGAGSKALLFSQYTSHLALVREALAARGHESFYLDGATPVEERGRLVERFQAGESSLFLISLKAGGSGITLTAADYVLHLDPWWNPAVEDQATDRAHRIGQTRPVTVYRLVATGTIEEQVLEMHADKRALANDVLSGADGALDVDSLVELLAEQEEPYKQS